MTVSRIYIDDRPCDVAPGQTVLEALHACGVMLPALCHHPGLSSPATCRSCLVLAAGEEGGRHPLTACNHTVTDGLRLFVDSADSRRLRRRALAEILQRHPVGCPSCERAGECELQAAVARHGPSTTPYELEPSAGRHRIGPHLILDVGRCIQCGRCARFEAEVSGSRALTIGGRGSDIAIRTDVDGVDHPLSGNLIDLCPAGALVGTQELFAEPSWSLRSVDTVCGACGTGCAVRADVDAAGVVQRLRPRDDEANGWWMCDRGRHDYDDCGGERLVHPLPPTPATDGAWEAGIDRLRQRLSQPRSAVWLSPFLSLEEIYLLLEAAHGWKASLYTWEALEETGERRFAGGFTLSAHAAPNARGLRQLLCDLEVEAGDSAALQAAIDTGRVDQLLMCGGGALSRRPLLHRVETVFVAAHDLVAGAAADLVMPASHWLEKDGCYINDAGDLRRVRPARPAPAGHLDLELALRLAGRKGGTPAAEIFAEVAARCPSIRPCTHAEMDAGARTRPGGVAVGGAWTDSLQRRGLLSIQDPAR